jgi:hypothetical protein
MAGEMPKIFQMAQDYAERFTQPVWVLLDERCYQALPLCADLLRQCPGRHEQPN